MAWELELPDGRVRSFPNDVTEAQAGSILIREYPELYPDAPSGFWAAAESSTKGLMGRLGAATDLVPGVLFGDEEQFQEGIRSLERAEEESLKALPAPVSIDDVSKAYEEEGFLSAAGTLGQLTLETMGQSTPYMAPMYGAGKIAAGPGARVLAKSFPALRSAGTKAPTPMARAAIGHTAGASSMIPAFFADNLSRQVDEGVATPEEMSLASAALAAPAQSAMEYVFVALMGKIGRAPQRAAADSIGKFIKRQSIEASTEIPTEMMQTVLERAQAGLTVSPQDAEAVREVVHAGILGGLAGAGFGTVSTASQYAGVRRARKRFEEEMVGEKTIREEADKIAKKDLEKEESMILSGDEESLRNKKLGMEWLTNIDDDVRAEAHASLQGGAPTPEYIHKIALGRNIKSNEDSGFMAFSKRLTGESKIDNMNDDQRMLLYDSILKFSKQKTLVSLPTFLESEYSTVLEVHRKSRKGEPTRAAKRLTVPGIAKSLGLSTTGKPLSKEDRAVASAIRNEMLHRKDAVRKNGAIRPEVRPYTEEQYQNILSQSNNRTDEATGGNIPMVTNRIISDVTGSNDLKLSQRIRDDMIDRGDAQRRGTSYFPISLESVLRDRVITSKESNGFLIRNSNGIVVGGSTRSRDALRLAKEMRKENPNQKYSVSKKEPGVALVETGTDRRGNPFQETIDFVKDQQAADERIADSTPDPLGPLPESDKGRLLSEPEMKARRKGAIDRRLKVGKTLEEEIAWRQKLLDGIMNAMTGIGLNGVRIRLSERLGVEGKPAEGDFDMNRIIRLSLERLAPDIPVEEQTQALIDIANHEMFHALVNVDLFTESEWAVLKNYVEHTVIPGNTEGLTYLQRASGLYQDSVEKGDMTREGVYEEAIAEAFRGYMRDPKIVAGQPRTLMDRVKRFFHKLGNYLLFNEFTTPQDILDSIRTGSIAAREKGVIRTIRDVDTKAGRNFLSHIATADDPLSGAKESRVGDATTPAKSLMDEFVEISHPNPFDGRERVFGVGIDGEVFNVNVEISPGFTDDSVRLNWIQATPPASKGGRGSGAGSHILRRITDLADKHGVTIEGTVSRAPGMDKELGLSVSDLRKWYKRNGFEKGRGAKDIIRKPKSIDIPTKESRVVPMEQRQLGGAFRSALGEALEMAPQRKMDRGGLMKYLRKSGVTEDEMVWTGLKEYLDGIPESQKSIAVDDVINNVVLLEVNETWFGGDDVDLEVDVIGDLNDPIGWSQVEGEEEGIYEKSITAMGSGEEFNYRVIQDEDAGNVSVQREDGSWLEVPEPINRQTLSGARNAIILDVETRATKPGQEFAGPAQYEDLTLPGGGNYRMLVISLPVEQREDRIADLERRLLSEEGLPEAEYEERNRLRAGVPFEAPPTFTGGHLGSQVPNPLVHARLKDRDGPKESWRNPGRPEKILFAEEIQDDWAKEARGKREVEIARLVKSEGITEEEATSRVPAEFGYHIVPNRDQIIDLKRRVDEAKREFDSQQSSFATSVRDSWQRLYDEHNAKADASGFIDADKEQWRNFHQAKAILYPSTSVAQQRRSIDDVTNKAITQLNRQERADLFAPGTDPNVLEDALYKYDEAHHRAVDTESNLADFTRITGPVPDRPFKNTSHILALKRIIAYAALNGYDAVGWTTGKQQVERSETQLRQAVDEIKWELGPSRLEALAARREEYEEDVHRDYSVTQYNDGEWVALDPQGRPLTTDTLPSQDAAYAEIDRAVEALSDKNARATGGNIAVTPVKDGELLFTVEVDPSNGIIVDGPSEAREKHLSKVVGKNVSEQVLAAPEGGSIGGENLTIGGAGFENIYDKELKQGANGIGKRFGAKVERADIEGEAQRLRYGVMVPNPAGLNEDPNPYLYDAFETEEQATVLAGNIRAGMDPNYDVARVVDLSKEESTHILRLNEKIVKSVEDQGFRLFGTKQSRIDQGISVEPIALDLPTKQSMAAYHGSPHQFKKFLLEKMGMGEGHQAYGWGLYFAQKMGVAGSYMQGQRMLLDGNPVLDSDFPSSFKDFLGDNELRKEVEYVWGQLGNVDGVISRFDGWASELENESLPTLSPEEKAEYRKPAAMYRQAVAWMESNRDRLSGSEGSLYEVTLDVNPEDLLDLDRPLSQQSEKVQKILAEMNPDMDPSSDEYDANEKGDSIYNRLVSHASAFAGADQIASRTLLKAGIPGSMYLDQMSRGKGEGTRNFVIWDEDVINIETRDGEKIGDELVPPNKYSRVGTIPRINTAASERAQQIARGEIEGEKMSENDWKPYYIGTNKYSMFDPAEGGNPDDFIKIPYKTTFFDQIMAVIEEKNWSDAITRLKQLFVDKYASIARMERKVVEKMREAGKSEREITIRIMAHQSAIAAAYRSDRASGILQAAIEIGIPVLVGGRTVVRALGIKIIDSKTGAITDGTGGYSKIFRPLLRNHINKDLVQDWGLIRMARREERFAYEGRGDVVDKETGIVLREGKRQMTAKQRAYYIEKFENALNRAQDPNVSNGTDEEAALIMNTVDENFTKWNDGFVDYLVKSQVINEAMGESWKKDSDYIPFYRQWDEDINKNNEAIISDALSGARKQFPNTPNTFLGGLTGVKPSKMAKEGDQSIADPMASILHNSLAAITSGLKNDAAIKVMRDAKYVGMARKLGKKGKYNEHEVSGDVHTIRENGENVDWEVTDSLLHDSLVGFTDGKLAYLNMVGMPSRWLREGVTRSPDFIVANMLRDTVSAWATSGTEIRPVIDTFRHMKLGPIGEEESESFKAMRAIGLNMGFDFSRDLSDAYKKTMKMYRREGIKREKDADINQTWNSVMKVWDWAGDVTTRSDMATRQAVYEDVLKRLKDVYGVEIAEAEAEYQAQEIINFSRRGNSTAARYITAAIPFLNARIQGLDVLWRAASGKYSAGYEIDEGKTEAIRKDIAGKAITAFMGRMSLLMTSALVYWTFVHDDDEYRNARPEVRQDNIILPNFGLVPGSIKIPKPFEVGLLAWTVPEMVAEFISGKQDMRQTNDAIWRGLSVTFAFNPVPQAVKPLWEAFNNHSSFTGRPIVPYYQGKLKPEMQSGLYTNTYAQILGELFNASPSKIEHILRGYTGTLGSYALFLADQATRPLTSYPERPDVPLDKFPMLRRFWQGEEGKGKLAEFYDFREASQELFNTVRKLREQGRHKDAREIVKKNKGIMRTASRLKRMDKEIQRLRKQERRIIYSRMDGTKKKDSLEKITKLQNRILVDINKTRGKADLPVDLPFPVSIFSR